MKKEDQQPVCDNIIKNEIGYWDIEIFLESKQDQYIFEVGTGSTDEEFSDSYNS